MSLLVSRKAPNFTSTVVMPDGKIEDNYQYYQKVSKYSVLFFYPLDFTFVCPSELISLSQNIDEFTNRNVDVLAISIDSQFSHAAWRNTPIQQGGIGSVNFTMVADTSHEICRIYGVEHFEANVALRATFIVDQDKVVRAQFVNDLPLGRNIGEILRTIDSLQHFEANGEVCPMNWEKGAKAMNPDAEGVKSWLVEKYPEQQA
jgi:peroxiredoxin 2/4|tara:strand:+ start:4082 stop:4690 length:609 start_codon:yes stop_codon:yes gene_type:complete